MLLSLQDISVAYSTRKGPVQALERLDLVVQPSSFVSVLGPSGCGKSTLVKLVAGLLKPTTGRISFDGVTSTGARDDVGVAFQQAALLPWKSAFENVLLPLRLKGQPTAAARERAEGLLDLVGLTGSRDSFPHELSGGMQQRVGIARALTSDPAILLMDEPLGALDALTRERAQELILKVWRDTGKMVFFITHSVEEALFMGTKLIVMSPRPGRISHVFDLPFSQRYFETGNARAIKASSEFIELREEILQIIFADEAGAEDE